MCDYQGYEFGAGRYPDSVCIDGWLHDADGCDDNGNIYLNDEYIPCPICRPADAICYWSERNALSVRDEEETEEQTQRRARDNAISLVTDIRANRGFETDVNELFPLGPDDYKPVPDAPVPMEDGDE